MGQWDYSMMKNHPDQWVAWRKNSQDKPASAESTVKIVNLMKANQRIKTQIQKRSCSLTWKKSEKKCDTEMGMFGPCPKFPCFLVLKASLMRSENLFSCVLNINFIWSEHNCYVIWLYILSVIWLRYSTGRQPAHQKIPKYLQIQRQGGALQTEGLIRN